MDGSVSQESKQQILQPLSVLRPKFRAVAQSLQDQDLVFIEEAFKRLFLDYDRVFSAMGVPACLWRRTGEIYKGNREFSELVGVDGYMLRDGRLCIYELMAEESAVNYWGNTAMSPLTRVKRPYSHHAFCATNPCSTQVHLLRTKRSSSLWRKVSLVVASLSRSGGINGVFRVWLLVILFNANQEDERVDGDGIWNPHLLAKVVDINF